jgi:hypothetical protein
MVRHSRQLVGELVGAGLRTSHDRIPMHGYEPTREAAMAAFGQSWRPDAANLSG